MSSFTKFNTHLKMEYVGPHPKYPNRTLFKLLSGFEFYLEDPLGDVVRVPEGFITDGASVPQVLWSLLPPWGLYGQAAVLHDYLIEGGKIRSKGGDRRVTRNEARWIFNDAMKVLNTPNFTRNMVVFGVFVWDVIKGNKISPTV